MTMTLDTHSFSYSGVRHILGLCLGLLACDFEGNLGQQNPPKDASTDSKESVGGTDGGDSHDSGGLDSATDDDGMVVTGGVDRTCQEEDCGPIRAIARMCEDGSVAGLECGPDEEGVCVWEDVCAGECAMSDCGTPPPVACADGVNLPYACVLADNGNCEFEPRACPGECLPEDCGPPSPMPVYECADGTFAGPSLGCVPTERGTCEWGYRECCCDESMGVPDCANLACCSDGSFSCGGVESCPAGPGEICQTEADSCVAEGASCTGGGTCCNGLECCAGVATLEGAAFCGQVCPE